MSSKNTLPQNIRDIRQLRKLQKQSALVILLFIFSFFTKGGCIDYLKISTLKINNIMSALNWTTVWMIQWIDTGIQFVFHLGPSQQTKGEIFAEEGG